MKPPGAPNEKVRSVYLHLPFCRHRCGYCNFSLVAGRDHWVERYLAALTQELERIPRGLELDTLFLGGGTPSHLSVKQLDHLGRIVHEHFRLAPDYELSAECNPADLDDARISALADLGVNRISLGAQSLSDQKLKRLERDHSGQTVRDVMTRLRPRFRSLSLDLIFAAPEETHPQWQADLEQAIELQPDHLSTYELTYEKGTQFWNRQRRGQLTAATEDRRAEMYQWTRETLASSGWQQYELSSYSKPGHDCRHNQVYWLGHPYYALGPGAAELIGGVRRTNHRSTLRYMQRIEAGVSPVAESERLEGIAAARERLAIGLRRIAGVERHPFQQSCGFDLETALGTAGEMLQEHHLVQLDSRGCRLTEQGVMVADGVATAIVSQTDTRGDTPETE